MNAVNLTTATQQNKDSIMLQIRQLQEQLEILERNGLKNVINNYFWTNISEKCRKYNHVLARQMYCYIRRNEGGLLNVIGDEIWKGYDHSSVIHSIKEFENRLILDKKVKKQYQEVLEIYKLKQELQK